MKEQINEQLELLEKELNRLKDITDYIDNTKKTAQEVVKELQDIQKKYSTYTDKIFELYKNSIEEIYSKNDKALVESFNHYKKSTDELKRETEILVKETVLQLENTGNQIDLTNREKLVEIKRLLENYRKTVEATDSLVKTLSAVNFPARLDVIENQTKVGLENIYKRFDTHDKNSKITKILLYIGISLGIANIVIRFI
jgi:hypothetical protein